jgi:arabinogalactan endo-1,4-beta-galactosidase
VRLRLWVQPPNGFNDLADLAAMARRIKQAHMSFLLDLHYSDFWADPGHQDTPSAWQGQDLATLATTVHDYTRRSCLRWRSKARCRTLSRSATR